MVIALILATMSSYGADNKTTVNNKNTPPPSSPNDKIMIERAKKLYTGVGSSKDYEGAYKIFWPLANSGNAEAARYVGLMKF